MSKEILIITVWEYSEKDFKDAKESNVADKFLRYLPTYCVREDTGKIDRSEYYFQFMGDTVSETNKKYILFDICYTSPLISQEISETGFEELLGDYIEIKDWAEFLRLFSNYNSPKQRKIPSDFVLLFDLDYREDYDYYSGGYEYELEMSLYGCLSNNEVVIRLNNNGQVKK